MITKDRELAAKLTDDDIRVIAMNLDATESYQWYNDNPIRVSIQNMDVWGLRQKKFIPQILASIVAKVAFHKNMICRMCAGDVADVLDLPIDFIKKLQIYIK